MVTEKITLIRISRNSNKNVNSNLQWFSNTLGLFTERDKEKSCFRVFLEILKVQKTHKGISSEQISIRSNLSRPTVVHHLNTLSSRGLIISENNRYFLRVKNLDELVDLIKSDTIEVLKDLNKTAKDLDDELGL